MLFEELFNKEHLSEYFLKYLINRNGGGRDRLSPQKYWEQHENDLDCIIEKCKNQSYTFSPYREVLIPKKRNKYPRCISIPTVRDRLVLGVLNEYLQTVFEEAINHETPNLLIQKVKLYLSLNKNKEIRFFKSDFNQFYDNIRHPILIFKAIWDTIRKNTLYEKRVYFETHSKNKINLWQIIK